MIKFFRAIRQRLFAENKISKYLLYAAGEIILVVIGILIAVQINNWNEDRKNVEKENKYLISIDREVVVDSLTLENTWFKNRQKKIECLELARSYAMGDYIPTDTLLFIRDVGFGGVSSVTVFTGSSGTYQELVSTGNLSLISNDSIREFIVAYYSLKDFFTEYSEKTSSGYAFYINGLRAYNAKYRDSINVGEIPRILAKLKTDEFHSLINQELTHAYAVERFLVQIKERSNNLHEMMMKYLKRE